MMLLSLTAPMRLNCSVLVALALAPVAQAEIALDATRTTWGGWHENVGLSYQNYDVINTTMVPGAAVYTKSHVGSFTPGQPPAGVYPHDGAALTMTQGSAFLTLMLNSAPTSPTDLRPDLSGTDLVGAPVHLTYTGLTAAPSYVALVGGTIQSYVYDAVAGSLSITATPGSVTATASTSGVSSALALMIETDPAHNFGGSVFCTNAYWADITTMDALYPGVMPVVGLNVNGVHGSKVTFDAYLTTAYLGSIGIFGKSDVRAYVQKNGVAFEVAMMSTLYNQGGVDPHMDGILYDTFGGASVFDLDGGGLDEVIKATYANASWSSGNIGLVAASAIPEPSTYGMMLGGLALAAAVMRRRKTAK